VKLISEETNIQLIPFYPTGLTHGGTYGMEFKRDFDPTDNGANSNSVIPYKPQLDQQLQSVKKKNIWQV
jgi:hypothetical protein